MLIITKCSGIQAYESTLNEQEKRTSSFDYVYKNNLKNVSLAISDCIMHILQ